VAWKVMFLMAQTAGVWDLGTEVVAASAWAGHVKSPCGRLDAESLALLQALRKMGAVASTVALAVAMKCWMAAGEAAASVALLVAVRRAVDPMAAMALMAP